MQSQYDLWLAIEILVNTLFSAKIVVMLNKLIVIYQEKISLDKLIPIFSNDIH